MVELMTVRLAKLVNASGNPQARLRLVIYAVPVCKKGRPNCGGPSEEGKRPAVTTGAVTAVNHSGVVTLVTAAGTAPVRLPA